MTDIIKSKGDKLEDAISNGESTEVLDYDGEGISQETLIKFNQAKKRFTKEWFNSFPQEDRPEVYRFLTGEGEYDIERGERNEINNPLKLIRPESLLSCDKLFEVNDRSWEAPKYYAKPKDRKSSDTTKEREYAQLVEAFEQVTILVMASLNIKNAEERKKAVKSQLEAIFSDKTESAYYTGINIPKVSPVDTPKRWLFYAVINVLQYPEDDITHIGKLRALELLKIYPADEIARDFRPEKKKFWNGYDQISPARLPYTFCSREERLTKNHKDIWKFNPRIKELMVAGSQGRVDWETTINNIVMRAPHEAIQIALLLLHDYNSSPAAIQLLQALPDLDRKTQGKMLGKRATFMIEHKFSRGTYEQVLAGLGLRENPTVDPIEETAAELRQRLARTLSQQEYLEEEVARAQAQNAELAWRIMQLEQELEYKSAQVEYYEKGAREKKPDFHARDIFQERDPKGHLRVLGLHPDTFNNLNEEQIIEVIKRQYRFFSGIYHPDKKGGSEQQMKTLNEAFEILSNRVTREVYLKNG